MLGRRYTEREAGITAKRPEWATQGWAETTSLAGALLQTDKRATTCGVRRPSNADVNFTLARSARPKWDRHAETTVNFEPKTTTPNA